MKHSEEEVLAVARPTMARRVLAVGALGGLGVVTLYLGLTQGSVASGVLIVTGTASVLMAEMIRRTTDRAVELTPSGLRDTDGTLIAATADVVHVDRGVLAIKPSNGFVLKTRARQSRGWRFGIWWRVGRTVGVGGMMPAPQTKFMADRLAELVAERDQT